MISEKEIEHLAELARIEIHEEQKNKLSRDLGEILEHFKVLEEVTTESVASGMGGTKNENQLREDAPGKSDFETKSVIEAFPEREKGFLKIPPVFE